jgi:large subunit ribosomal protein L31
MKPGIHPAYGPVVFRDKGAGTAFLTRSTATSANTVEWSDGNTYPVIDVEISSASHPFWTGRQRLIDTAGRIEKFRRKYAKTHPTPEQ